MDFYSSSNIVIGNTDFTITSHNNHGITTDIWNADPHIHPFLEMHILHHGRVSIKTDTENILLAGKDICIIPSRCCHSVKTLSPNVVKLSIYLHASKNRNAHEDTYSVFEKLFNASSPLFFSSTSAYAHEIFTLSESASPQSVIINCKARFLLSLILCEIYETLTHAAEEKNTENTDRNLSYQTELLLELETALDNTIMKSGFEENNLSFNMLAKQLHLSTAQLRRLIKKHFNCTYRELIFRYKIEKAKLLIENGETSLENIAGICGYSTYAGFYKGFIKFSGVSPEEYRNICKTKHQRIAYSSQ